jgi:predicted metal-dependent hydrolase
MRSRIDVLRSAAERALESHNALLAAWRQLSEQDLSSFTLGDVDLLQRLVLSRIYPINAFAVLARLDKQAAIDVLLGRYVGNAVDPDTKFGGYTFELSSMLEDLAEAQGEESLRELLNRPNFAASRLHDPRVIAAIGDALNINSAEVVKWLNQSWGH